MKEMTKQIRTDVKNMILAVGGTKNLTGRDTNSLLEKYCPDWEKKWDSKVCEISTAIHNQVDYYKFAKNM